MSVRKFRVLIADDDDLQILYIKDILRDLGYESRSVSDADSVIPKMKEFDPDAVILDMQMYYKGKFNETAGSEVLTKISEDKDLKDIPVIICSSINSIYFQLKSIMVDHCNDFLVKPVKREKFLKRIKRYSLLGYIYKEQTKAREEYAKIREHKTWVEKLLP